MSEPHVTLAAGQLGPVGEKLREPLEQQLTSALRAAAEQIAAGYAGEPVDQVCRELLERTRDGLHPDIAAAFQPDHAELRRVATAITEGKVP